MTALHLEAAVATVPLDVLHSTVRTLVPAEPQVVATARTDPRSPTRGAAERATERLGEATASAAGEHVEQFGDIDLPELEISRLVSGERVEAGIECGVSTAVVLGALFLVGEHRKRLGDLFERFLGPLVTLVGVGVVFAGEGSVAGGGFASGGVVANFEGVVGGW